MTRACPAPQAQPLASTATQYLERVETLKKPNTYRKYEAVLKASPTFRGTVAGRSVVIRSGSLSHRPHGVHLSRSRKNVHTQSVRRDGEPRI